MRIIKHSNAVWPVAALLASLLSSPAHSVLPDNSYACQVETRKSGPGLVMVQAHTVQDARRLALQFDALTRNGTRARGVTLVECIDAPQGRFNDPMFQYFYENLER